MTSVSQDSVSQNSSSPAGTSAFTGLAPLVLVVFLGFLAVGVPIAALALDVKGPLGFGSVTVGWVIGIQSLATVLTRHRAGTVSDARGPRHGVLLGLPLAAISGVFYLLSAVLPAGPGVKLALLLIGRVVMGLGESLFLTGAMSWGIARLGPARTGKAMAWQGIALYAALGAGAPAGLALQSAFGFAGVGVATMILPLAAFGIALALPAVPASGGTRVPFYQVIGLIWRPGLVLAFATVPFAAMATFLALDFAAHGWQGAGLALSGFGAGYILVRLVGSQWADSARAMAVVLGSLVIETLGQILLWLAPGPGIAMLAAALTGIGFSLVFPAMGVIATRIVPAEMRGRAVGNFIAFFDVALGVTGPAIGVLAGAYGNASAFLVGAGATVAASIFLFSVRPAERDRP